MITKIGTAALEVMRENNWATVTWGDVDVLDAIGSIGIENSSMMHPLDRHETILAALDRDHRFRKFYIQGDICTKHGVWQKRRLRAFKPL